MASQTEFWWQEVYQHLHWSQNHLWFVCLKVWFSSLNVEALLVWRKISSPMVTSFSEEQVASIQISQSLLRSSSLKNYLPSLLNDCEKHLPPLNISSDFAFFLLLSISLVSDTTSEDTSTNLWRLDTYWLPY